jgi:hypothetical protein
MIQNTNKIVKLPILFYVSSLILLLVLQVIFASKGVHANEVQFTDKQARALQLLNTEMQNETTKSLRLSITTLEDNQGQKYLGALVTRADLLAYLTQLQQILMDDFNEYRALQAARDHHSFHLTLLSPNEYQLADKKIIETLIKPDVNNFLSGQFNVTLLGLGKVEQDDKTSFFVVAQSADAQLIRQRFILPAKDFHITLGFNPSDIYGVNKSSSTLLAL